MLYRCRLDSLLSGWVEYDNCYNEGRSGIPKISYDRYANMSRALNRTGRPILYSMCNWGEDQPWNFAQVSSELFIFLVAGFLSLYFVIRILQTVGGCPETLPT
jgi:Alpha galactosidase A